MVDEALRGRLVELATTTYDGVNRSHLAELLAEREGIVVAPRTLRRILAEAAVEPVRTRRSPRHRSRRERMPREGMLLQVDGSRHRWFGPDSPFATLVAGIDDATSRVPGGTFRAAEDAVGYFTTFAQTAERHVFRAPPTPIATGSSSLIGTGPRPSRSSSPGSAASPRWGEPSTRRGSAGSGPTRRRRRAGSSGSPNTLQDRLVTELRLEGITRIEDANVFLPGFLLRHNARFAVPAADPTPAWRSWPDGLSGEAVFCFHYPRRVSRDSTISWPDGDLALPRRSDGRSWAGRSVILQERLDGSLWISHEDICVPVRPAPADPGQLRARRLASSPSDHDPMTELAGRLEPGRPPVREPASGVIHRPGPDHPWRGRRGRS